MHNASRRARTCFCICIFGSVHVCAHTQTLACVCMHACVCVWICCMSMSMGQVSDLLMDIKRSWPAPHQNPSLEPPPLSHTHPALCRVRECDLVPIPEEGWALMTASSDTLRSPEPPSPAGPLSPLGRDPLVHTGRGLRSGLDSHSLSRLHTPCSIPEQPTRPSSATPRLVPLTWTESTEPIVGGQCNWSQTCSFSAVCNERQRLSSVYVSSSEATATHNGTKTLSITIKWVCVRGVEGKGEGDPRSLGWSLCVLNVQGDAKTQCGTLKSKGRGRVGASGHWGVGVCCIWENENWGAQGWMGDLFTNWMNTGVTAKSH